MGETVIGHGPFLSLIPGDKMPLHFRFAQSDLFTICCTIVFNSVVLYLLTHLLVISQFILPETSSSSIIAGLTRFSVNKTGTSRKQYHME
jgi:hypothetical protein